MKILQPIVAGLARLGGWVRNASDHVKATGLPDHGDAWVQDLKKQISLVPPDQRAGRIERELGPWILQHQTSTMGVPGAAGRQMAELVNSAPECDRTHLARGIMGRIPAGMGTAPSLGIFISNLTVGHDVRETLVDHALTRMQALKGDERLGAQAAFLAMDARNLPRLRAVVTAAGQDFARNRLSQEALFEAQKCLVIASAGDVGTAQSLMKGNADLLRKKLIDPADFIDMASCLIERVKEEERPGIAKPYLAMMVGSARSDLDAGSPLAEFAQIAALPADLWAEHKVMAFPGNSPCLAMEARVGRQQTLVIFDSGGFDLRPDLALPRNRQGGIDLTNAHLPPAMVLVKRRAAQGKQAHLS